MCLQLTFQLSASLSLRASPSLPCRQSSARVNAAPRRRTPVVTASHHEHITTRAARSAALAATAVAAAHLLHSSPLLLGSTSGLSQALAATTQTEMQTQTQILAQTQTLAQAQMQATTLSADSSSAAADTAVDGAGPSVRELREQTQRNTRLSGKTSQQFTQARRLAELGDLDGALTAYDALSSVAPTFAPTFSNRANILVTKGNYARAIIDYSRALELAPLDGDAWVLYLNRGVARLASGEEPRAVLDDLNSAADRRGGDPVVLSNRAAVYESMGKWESAIRDYQAALKGNDVKPFWLRYGLVLFQKGKPAESLAILRRVNNAYDVDDVKAALAIIYFDEGDIASAETQWSIVERPRRFESRAFLLEKKWPPRAVEAMDRFRSLKE